MSNQLIDIVCPNCSVPRTVRTTPEIPAPSWTVTRKQAQVRCATCGWEFIIDSDGAVGDDGEIDREAELEIDAEGDLTDPEPNDDTFSPWHGIASLAREVRGGRGWRDFCDDPFAAGDEDRDKAPVRRVGRATCPNCRQHFKEVWFGHVCCPSCDWLFRVDCDEPEDEDYDDEDSVHDSAVPTSPEAQALRPLIVSPSGHDDFTSLAAAVRRADPGRRILVRPGLYEEEIDVHCPMAILGDGPREQIILAGRRGPCLTMQCSTAIVSGLTLRGLDRDRGRKSPAVQLYAGLVEKCAITSAALACVKLQGGWLRRCRIHDGERAGVQAVSGAVEECDILCNGGPGVLVEQDGSVFINHCRIHDGHAEGVVIRPCGHALLVGCDVYANARAGVLIRGERTLLWQCRIHDGAAEGIRIPAEGVGFVEHCDIFANARAGLRIAGGSVYVWRSRIHEGKDVGVRLSGRGVIDLRRCTIWHNARAGVAVDAQAQPIIRRCRLRDNHQASRA